jgi:hypothetical protein
MNKELKGRINIGSVVKSKDKEKSNYVKVRSDLGPITLQPGEYIQVESPQFQLESLDRLADKGILSAENAEKAKERVIESQNKRKEMNNGVDFVLADLFITRK